MGRSDQKLDVRGANLMQALSRRTEAVVHLTHNDLDAVGSDAIHRRVYGEVFTVWSSVGKFLANLDAVAGSPGRNDLLSISDVGYQQGVEQRLALLQHGLGGGKVRLLVVLPFQEMEHAARAERGGQQGEQQDDLQPPDAVARCGRLCERCRHVGR